MKTKLQPDPEAITITKDQLWLMLLSTIRYSMGRRTYITAICKDLVYRFIQYLEPWQQKQIAEEIQKELDRAHKSNQLLGDQCDEDCWRDIVQFLMVKEKIHE